VLHLLVVDVLKLSIKAYQEVRRIASFCVLSSQFSAIEDKSTCRQEPGLLPLASDCRYHSKSPELEDY
jgi:hypothetical protein